MTSGLLRLRPPWLCQCHSVSVLVNACERALLCIRVSMYVAFFFLKFNSHCVTSPQCLRKSSVRAGSWGGLWWVSMCLLSMYVYVCFFVPYFLFALIPLVAQAIHSLSAINPLPCSEGKDRAQILHGLTLTLYFCLLSSHPSTFFILLFFLSFSFFFFPGVFVILSSFPHCCHLFFISFTCSLFLLFYSLFSLFICSFPYVFLHFLHFITNLFIMRTAAGSWAKASVF